MTRLLAIDFDYFFPVPTMAEDPTDVLDFDWSSRETPFHIGPVWYDRAAAFLRQGKELPRCNEDYEKFWSRFDLEDAVSTRVSDSNLYAGVMFPSSVDIDVHGDYWDEVWLFDAHHDCGYNPDALDQLQETDKLDCANWMLNHHLAGSELHVRYPQWRGRKDGTIVEAEARPAIEIDRQIDDGKPIDGPFDAVAICRSGAWVPSWCDDQFEAFIDAAPGYPLWIDEYTKREREFDPQHARDLADTWKQLFEEMQKRSA